MHRKYIFFLRVQELIKNEINKEARDQYLNLANSRHITSFVDHMNMYCMDALKFN